ncbi:MAG TPA: arginyltransferase, partial [Stellaceae bacterium]|nr:arginyltransferase [Stellaceae bacterium]
MPEGHGRTHPLPRREARALTVAPQQFYRTASLPCPYIADRFERKLVTELLPHDATAFYNDLSRAGFRRSHHLAYRPTCAGCSSCVPVRIPVAEFQESRSLRRIRRTNLDLTIALGEARASLEQFQLFVRYQRSRHAEGDMAAMTYGDYRAMIENSPVATRLSKVRDANRQLVGVGLLDVLDDGVSAVYSFFEPDL